MADVQPPGADVWAGFAPLASAATGLAMRYAERYRAGKPFSWRQILVDTPVLLGGFYLGPGVADMMGWSGKTGNAVSLVFAYFGVRLLDALWVKMQAQIADKVKS